MTRSGFERCSKNEQPTLAIENSLFVQRFPSYYKLTIDEEELIEIDAINLVRKVGGTDQMEAIRAAIGL